MSEYEEYYSAQYVRQDAERERLWAMRKAIRDQYPELFAWVAAEFANAGHAGVAVCEWDKR